MGPGPRRLITEGSQGGMNQLAGFGVVEPLWKSQLRLLLFLLLSVIWRRVFLFFLSEPGRDASRGYQLSRQMRVDSAGIDSQSLIELRSCEVPGFLFSLKSSSCPRASPPRQYTAFLHLESHVPRIRHLSPGVTHRHYSDVQQSRSFQSFRSSGWASRTAFRPHRQA